MNAASGCGSYRHAVVALSAQYYTMSYIHVTICSYIEKKSHPASNKTPLSTTSMNHKRRVDSDC